MPNDKKTTTPPDPTPPPSSDGATSAPTDENTTDAAPVEETQAKPQNTELAKVLPEVVNKIDESHNILVALSGDPSVDEMSAAIGLTIFLDKLGKRATAIYSGSTPNALEFLKPEETFESSVDILQDFVIALSKEKADHLRYKLDGDFVKIYITPYRARISEEDLDFSYGDFNVDLVLALDVANGIDLDSALREHGRIMHDAVIINITTGNPGKLGEIEWSDKSASSVSEMIAKLLYSMSSKVKIEKEEATAFLTGIVAATNRFSNAKTTSDAMKLASRLMESGANQQLISKNITPDIDNELYSLTNSAAVKTAADPTKLDIEHGNEEGVDETKEVDTVVTEKESTLLEDLKAAEASLAQAGAETTPESGNTTLKIDSDSTSDQKETEEAPAPESETAPEPETASESDTTSEPESTLDSTSETETKESEESESEKAEDKTDSGYMSESPEPTTTAEPTAPKDNPSADFISDKPEKVVQPENDLGPSPLDEEGVKKYGQMLENALAGIGGVSSPVPEPVPTSFDGNPATFNAPTVPTNPEINGVPEINYMPMPGEEVLPPPPAPPIDMNSASGVGVTPGVNEAMPDSLPTVAPIAPATPPVEPNHDPLGAQPAMQDQIYAPQVSDPGAFKIPGM